MRFSHPVDIKILRAVDEGLSSTPKSLPSWLFYDETGDKLFQSIMKLPQYYLTRSEYEILQSHKERMLAYFKIKDEPFSLIELGAGDGVKTEVLIQYFVSNNVNFNYLPVDISASVLELLRNKLTSKFPALDVNPLRLHYEDSLKSLTDDQTRKVVLFLGANIGNYTIEGAQHFLYQLAADFTSKDLLLIGFDLKKNPQVILNAYNDPAGVTRQFNMNLLERLNRELDADFKLSNFIHYPVYHPVSGTAESYLISTCDQEIYIDALRKTFTFSAWETIHTEVSQKYDLEMITHMISKAGFEIVDRFFDRKQMFCDVLLQLQR